MRTSRNSVSSQCGSSYVEVLAAVVIIAVSVIPASNALRGALGGTIASNDATINHYRLVGKLEEVLSQPFSTVSAQAAGPSTASTYSDAAGTVNRRLVYVSLYDGDNADADNNPFTGTDPGLLWLRVEIEGTVNAIQALKAQ